jgi:hypothetical protein
MMLDWVAAQERTSRLFTWGSLQRELMRGLRLPGHSDDDVRHALG